MGGCWIDGLHKTWTLFFWIQLYWLIWFVCMCVERLQFSSVQSLSHVQLFATPWKAAHQASLSTTNSWSSPKLMSIELEMMTIGKTIALTGRTFFGKAMSLLLNILSRLVITFLPRSKHLLISWLQSPSAVILERKKTKSDTVSTVSPSIFHEVMGPDAWS